MFEELKGVFPERLKQEVLEQYEKIQQERADNEANFYALMGLHPEYKETKAYPNLARLFSKFPEKPKNFENMGPLEARLKMSDDMRRYAQIVGEIVLYVGKMIDEKMDKAMGTIGDAE